MQCSKKFESFYSNPPLFEGGEEKYRNTEYQQNQIHQDTLDTDDAISQECRLFGIFSLPKVFQRLFLNAAWILVFLSWAATLQVSL